MTGHAPQQVLGQTCNKHFRRNKFLDKLATRFFALQQDFGQKSMFFGQKLCVPGQFFFVLASLHQDFGQFRGGPGFCNKF